MKQKSNSPCIHGNLCREYWTKHHVIYCVTCPTNCKYYVPKYVKSGVQNRNTGDKK